MYHSFGAVGSGSGPWVGLLYCLGVAAAAGNIHLYPLRFEIHRQLDLPFEILEILEIEVDRLVGGLREPQHRCFTRP